MLLVFENQIAGGQKLVLYFRYIDSIETSSGGSKGVNMEIIKESMMQWGETMPLIMENRAMFYSPVLKHWRVKKLAGMSAKSFLYDGESFEEAFACLLWRHATGLPTGEQGEAETKEE
jgi:hypothetical protein